MGQLFYQYLWTVVLSIFMGQMHVFCFEFEVLQVETCCFVLHQEERKTTTMIGS